nr:DUF2500 domain-containing protein [Anaerosporobacter faecicola]
MMPDNSLFMSGFFVIFFIIFAMVIITFGITIVKGVKQWSNNNNSPVLTVMATVVSKRIKVRNTSSNLNDNSGLHTSSSTDYFVTFEVESGDRLEFEVHGEEYGLLVEKDQGKLTFQGTRYQGFARL